MPEMAGVLFSDNFGSLWAGSPTSTKAVASVALWMKEGHGRWVLIYVGGFPRLPNIQDSITE